MVVGGLEEGAGGGELHYDVPVGVVSDIADGGGGREGLPSYECAYGDAGPDDSRVGRDGNGVYEGSEEILVSVVADGNAHSLYESPLRPVEILGGMDVTVMVCRLVNGEKSYDPSYPSRDSNPFT